MQVHIETLGCRLNQIESEGAADFFCKSGFSVTMNPVCANDRADEEVCVCVLNTCSVTTKAEQKARRTIRLLLQKFPNSILVVTGCYAQLSAKEICAMDARIAVIPGLAKSVLADVPEKIKAFFESGDKKGGVQKCGFTAKDVFGEDTLVGKSGLQAASVAAEPFKLLPQTFFSHSRAGIKIQDGCNNNCSYCAIHLARGKSVSIPPALAVERVKALEREGYSEVVLTGVNIAQYSVVGEGGAADIADLLELILAGTKKIAIRFSSIYPETVTPKFCEVIKDTRVRPHFHISVQSGSDAILKRMNRRYTRENVIQSCRRLKDAKKNPFLACDIIAGFPGETEEDFLQTMGLLKTCGFVNAHAFPFSPRPGTAAFAYTPKIPERVKGERVKALNEFSAEQKICYINSFVGTELPAVFESVRSVREIPRGKKLLHAVTENFIHAEIFVEKNFPAPKEGCELKIKILAAQEEKIRAGDEWEALGAIC